MKRRDVVAHLLIHGCSLLREGARHSIFVNPSNNRISTVPRHAEVNDHLVVKICKDLDIPRPGARNGRPM